MSNKGRLPALGLGAERLEQHARLQAHLLYRHQVAPELPGCLHQAGRDATGPGSLLGL